MAAPRKYSDELRERATRMAIELLPGAADELLRLGPLIRPLIEVHWTRMVAEINGVASADLEADQPGNRYAPPGSGHRAYPRLQRQPGRLCHRQ